MNSDSLPSLNVIYPTDTEIKGTSPLTLKKCNSETVDILMQLSSSRWEFNLQVDKGNDQAYRWDFPSVGSLESCDLTAGVIVLCLRAYC